MVCVCVKPILLRMVLVEFFDRTGAPGYLWLWCTEYYCQMINMVEVKGLYWRTPTEVALGITPDISPFLNFHFYEACYYLEHYEPFPSTKEKKGFRCGPTENCVDFMTYLILTNDTNKLIA